MWFVNDHLFKGFKKRTETRQVAAPTCVFHVLRKGAKTKDFQI